MSDIVKRLDWFARMTGQLPARRMAEDAAAEIRRLREQVKEPTPEALRAWADWFDDPKNPRATAYIAVPIQLLTAGYLLRRVADAMLALPTAPAEGASAQRSARSPYDTNYSADIVERAKKRGQR